MSNTIIKGNNNDPQNIIKEKENITIDELLLRVKRDLEYLDGAADALFNGRLKSKVNSLRGNINKLEEKINE